ncbi:MAG: outer membrane protein assembly factor BamD [Bacteroidales bacterium]
MRFILPFMLLFLAASCSNYQKIVKSNDNDFKFEKAVEYYEDEDYNKAIGLLTDVIPAFRGTQKAEQVNYYYAMAHYKMRDYTLASHYFKSFVTAFPGSENAEEFLFLSAYSKYLESPRPSLDQTPTREAIGELQSFINRYPQSERVADANELIDELRAKLEEKTFQKGVLYFNILDYRAAVTTFRNLLRDYPDTEYREQALFYIVRAHYEFAQLSIPSRQAERYREVTPAFELLLTQFPDSQYLAEAARMSETALSAIEELQSTEEITENN